MKEKEPLALNQVLLRHMLFRLFLPLLAIGFVAIGVAGYFGIQTLVKEQKHGARAVAQAVDAHLEQGGRILDAMARSAEKSSLRDLGVFMQSTWEAYRHFETIYFLGADNRIRLIVPFDQRYIGMDLSRLSDIQQTGETNRVAISRPFTSLRTGDPTVYLVMPLSHGGRLVGELNLGAFQQEIAKEMGTSGKDSVFIMDQFGTLLAHPDSSLVREQTNLSSLKIFRVGSKGEGSVVYEYTGARVLGSSIRVNRVGWVVVDQIPLSVLLIPYALALGMVFLVLLGIWWMLAWNLRKELHRNIVAPLVRLSRSTDALAAGDYSKSGSLFPLPAAFTELNKLANDFLHMSNALRVREAALQESEKRYRNLFDGVPLGIFRTTSEGHILDANPALVHILGYPDRETLLATNSAKNYVSQEDRAHWKTSADEEGIVHGFETQMRQPDGSIIWVRMSGRIMHDGADRMTYNEGVMEDITKRKRTEDALKAAQEELIRKEKLAILGQLAGIVGHEIRNPLGVINNAVYFLKTVMTDADDIVKEYLDIIKQEIDNSQHIIADLLDFARTKIPKITPITVGALVTQALDKCTKPENIDVQTDIPDTLPQVNVDPFQMGQVLQNLIINAVQAMPAGGALRITAQRVASFKTKVASSESESSLLQLETFNLKPDTDFIEISITDTGEGISPENMEKLFQPLFTTKSKGIGLGLVVCKNLVEANGGKIEVESKPEKGTTFRIILPVEAGK